MVCVSFYVSLSRLINFVVVFVYLLLNLLVTERIFPLKEIFTNNNKIKPPLLYKL